MPRKAAGPAIWGLVLAVTSAPACKKEDDADPFAEDESETVIDLRGTDEAASAEADSAAAAPAKAEALPGVTQADMLPLFGDRVAGEPARAGNGRGIALGAQDDGTSAAPDGGLAAAFKHTTDASYAACETAKAARAYYGELAALDGKLCAFRSTLAAAGPTAVDGHAHALHGTGAFDHARFRVVRAGPAAPFADVTVDLCKGGKQIAHARYEMTETSLHLAAKTATVAGTLDAGLAPDGRIAGAKKIVVERHDGAATSLTESTQTANELVLSRAGDKRIFVDVELLDANVAGMRYAFANLSLGDGAALIADGVASVRQGWSGDTWEATDGVPQVGRVNDVKSDELLQRPAARGLGFERDEAYECDQVEDLTVGGDFDPEAAMCPDGGLPAGDVDCRAVTVSTAGR